MAAATTLLEAIQAAWTADGTLAGLVPNCRVFFGKVPPAGNIGDEDPSTPEMPYARVELPEGTPGVRSNACLYADQPIIVHVWTDTGDQGDQIGREVERVLSHNLNWTTGGTLDCRFHPHSTTKLDMPEIEQWETICTFAMKTWQARFDIHSSSSSGS
jgi:hypothetical protein